MKLSSWTWCKPCSDGLRHKGNTVVGNHCHTSSANREWSLSPSQRWYRRPKSRLEHQSTYSRFGIAFERSNLLGTYFISGFVISYTLENTSHLKLFWKKRLIRLWPSIIVATIITFIFFNLFDPNFLFPESHYARNFLPSFTFVIPDFFNTVFSKPQYFNYINGVYWSLWPEIQFYMLVSLLYYYNKEKK